MKKILCALVLVTLQLPTSFAGDQAATKQINEILAGKTELLSEKAFDEIRYVSNKRVRELLYEARSYRSEAESLDARAQAETDPKKAESLKTRAESQRKQEAAARKKVSTLVAYEARIVKRNEFESTREYYKSLKTAAPGTPEMAKLIKDGEQLIADLKAQSEKSAALSNSVSEREDMQDAVIKKLDQALAGFLKFGVTRSVEDDSKSALKLAVLTVKDEPASAPSELIEKIREAMLDAWIYEDIYLSEERKDWSGNVIGKRDYFLFQLAEDHAGGQYFSSGYEGRDGKLEQRRSQDSNFVFFVSPHRDRAYLCSLFSEYGVQWMKPSSSAELDEFAKAYFPRAYARALNVEIQTLEKAIQKVKAAAVPDLASIEAALKKEASSTATWKPVVDVDALLKQDYYSSDSVNAFVVWQDAELKGKVNAMYDWETSSAADSIRKRLSILKKATPQP